MKKVFKINSAADLRARIFLFLLCIHFFIVHKGYGESLSRIWVPCIILKMPHAIKLLDYEKYKEEKENDKTY